MPREGEARTAAAAALLGHLRPIKTLQSLREAVVAGEPMTLRGAYFDAEVLRLGDVLMPRGLWTLGVDDFEAPVGQAVDGELLRRFARGGLFIVNRDGVTYCAVKASAPVP